MSVEAAKPLQGKGGCVLRVYSAATALVLFRLYVQQRNFRSAKRCASGAGKFSSRVQRYALGEWDVALFVLVVAALVVAQTWLDWRDAKKLGCTRVG